LKTKYSKLVLPDYSKMLKSEDSHLQISDSDESISCSQSFISDEMKEQGKEFSSSPQQSPEDRKENSLFLEKHFQPENYKTLVLPLQNNLLQ
jgi:hypothetical protein